VSAGVDLYAPNKYLVYHRYTNALEPCASTVEIAATFDLFENGRSRMIAFLNGALIFALAAPCLLTVPLACGE
jgi:hypothetical protein